MQEDGRSTFVVGDVHGHLDELLAALADAGLVDEETTWSGGGTHLWFLGDFVDRGPDGIGVIDLVMRLSEEARAAGGQVQTLLGNHEILLLGMYHFGDTEVPSDFGPRSFARSWELNGGQPSDQDALTDAHVEWLTSRPAIALVENHLLMHSDTVEYLVWGGDIDEINTGIHDVLRSEDLVEWWEVWRRLTTRHAFRGPHGAETASQLLTVLGGERVVHGHSVIADQLGIAPAQVEGPYEYADGYAVGVDGGVFVGGPCLVVPLPWNPGPAEPDDADADDTAPDDTDTDTHG
ncbi:serine/threonine protein phosphatase [Actinophytocola xinjiangensis]|uniref:Serine/threonine protein phosphatase n=1 Tax=Actinophytocola xinjiangensis TaxID=485602 RepID=A0A7Z1AXL3_9PSEU|nr:metallophosphoesterase [Actinophytocola xinjiangensis]OLF09329.1 serine/threonine protein phosphatase [Actinophytocola xinjiangensis]